LIVDVVEGEEREKEFRWLWGDKKLRKEEGEIFGLNNLCCQ